MSRLASSFAVLATLVAIAAAAPSLVPGMPDEVAYARNDRLKTDQYTALADAWRAYLAEHPGSAVAEVQIGRARRYAGDPAEDVRDHFARALALDPNCPEALDAAASTFLGEWEPLAVGAAGCYALGLRAVAQAPDWPEPHFTLLPLALVLGRSEEADRHAAAVVRKGGIASPVLDYCYNMLVGAEPGAIIFTNGDNDTYGCCALQAAFDLRPDVHILNLSLLNQPDIEATLMAGFGDQPPLSATERRDLRREFQVRFVHDRELYSTRFVKALAAKELDRPLYLAVTVSGQVLDACPQPRRLEGLLWRILPGSSDDTDAGTDVVRTRELLTGAYRLESATDRAFLWQDNRSVAKLMDNYSAIFVRLAMAAGENGDTETMRLAFRRGLELAAFHGRDGTVATMTEYWQELDPDNPEILRQD